MLWCCGACDNRCLARAWSEVSFTACLEVACALHAAVPPPEAAVARRLRIDSPGDRPVRKPWCPSLPAAKTAEIGP